MSTTRKALTPRQEAVLRSAAEHPKGWIVGCSFSVTKRLIEAGWVESKTYTITLPRTGRVIDNLIYVITPAGRAVLEGSS